MTPGLSRRRFLQAAGSAFAAASTATAATALGAPLAAAPARPALPPAARVGLLQTRSRRVEPTRPQADLQRNLEHMLWRIDQAQADGPPHDWLAFHECPLTGWERWSPAEAARVALDLDGPEIARLAASAREHRCHLSFGALLRLRDWPGRIVDATVFLSRSGDLQSLQWTPLAAHAGARRPAVTTIEDVLDEYVERYGREALVRVARTDIGDLCAAPTADDPALHAALARAGAQFVLRTHAGPLPPWGLSTAACCRRDALHGGLVNASAATDLPQFLASPTGGGSALHGPDGAVLAAAPDGGERTVSAVLQLGSGRRTAGGFPG
jgi:predicted amidohydrolase